MQPRSRGIGKHVESVELGAPWPPRRCKGVVVVPILLPTRLDSPMVISHGAGLQQPHRGAKSRRSRDRPAGVSARAGASEGGISLTTRPALQQPPPTTCATRTGPRSGGTAREPSPASCCSAGGTQNTDHERAPTTSALLGRAGPHKNIPRDPSSSRRVSPSTATSNNLRARGRRPGARGHSGRIPPRAVPSGAPREARRIQIASAYQRHRRSEPTRAHAPSIPGAPACSLTKPAHAAPNPTSPHCARQ